MSQTIYNHFSYFLDLIKKNPGEIYTMKPEAYSERFGISIEAAQAIKSVANDVFLHRGYVYAGLLALAKTPGVSPTFWTNFKKTITYVFIEFAKNQFFPFTHIEDHYDCCEPEIPVEIKRLDIEGYTKAYEMLIGDKREYEKLYTIISPDVKAQDRFLHYIAGRMRGSPEHLASLALAASLVPVPYFDWNSCLRGDEYVQLMMFGIVPYNAREFNDWCRSYENYFDEIEKNRFEED
jgi:hypothetical protein